MTDLLFTQLAVPWLLWFIKRLNFVKCCLYTEFRSDKPVHITYNIVFFVNMATLPKTSPMADFALHPSDIATPANLAQVLNPNPLLHQIVPQMQDIPQLKVSVPSSSVSAGYSSFFLSPFQAGATLKIQRELQTSASEMSMATLGWQNGWEKLFQYMENHERELAEMTNTIQSQISFGVQI